MLLSVLKVVDARAGPGGKSQLRSKLKHRLTTLTSDQHGPGGLSSTLKRRPTHTRSGFSVLKKYKHRSPKKLQRLRRMRLYGMRLRSDQGECLSQVVFRVGVLSQGVFTVIVLAKFCTG